MSEHDSDHDIDKRLDRIEKTIKERDDGIVTELDLILERVGLIWTLLTRKLTQGKVHITMKTIQVGGTSLATLALQDQNGSTMTIDSTYTVTYSASNPASVTLGTPNADGSATVTGVAADPGNTIGAVVTRPDGVQVTLTPDTLVITTVPPPTQVLTSGAVVLT